MLGLLLAAAQRISWKNIHSAYGILAVALATLGIFPQATAQPLTLVECPSPQQITDDLLRGINAIRAEPRQCGPIHQAAAPPLAWNNVLFRVAQQHAADMAQRGYFSHNTPEGIRPGQRADAAGYAWTLYGQNIGVGQASVKDVLDTWLASATHCQIMMKSEFRDVALACAKGQDHLLWALELGAQ